MTDTSRRTLLSALAASALAAPLGTLACAPPGRPSP
ncbi:twin-arginine translocation signal domain-containing protein [Streptomyces aurantiogriseus]|nr:twin-arginine translocation signal domain-containing protein [Streptomyces aurantiogriseus]